MQTRNFCALALLVLGVACTSPSETQLAVQLTTDSSSYALASFARMVLVRTINVSGDTVRVASCNGSIRPGLERQTPQGWGNAVFLCGGRTDGRDVVSGVPLPPSATRTDTLWFLQAGTFRVRAPILVGRTPRYSDQRSAPFEMR
jgi:hypothetical protein